ncbi:MAG: hypothetical protein AAF658_05965 [Myxococcota bacterium]
MRINQRVWAPWVCALLVFCAACGQSVTSPSNSPFPEPFDPEPANETFAGIPARWNPGETVPVHGRRNPLGVPESELTRLATAGREHTLRYPVEVTGFLVPFDPLLAVVEGQTDSPIRQLIADALPRFTGIHDRTDVWELIGLVPDRDGSYMGVTVMDTDEGRGFTFSCAACHAGRLFGEPIWGLHNRRSRANSLFVQTKPLFDLISPNLFRLGSGASDEETAMYERTRENMRFIDSVEPRAFGLDTALAHTILSISLRENDPWATRTDEAAESPRPNPLLVEPCDVKPATWWLTKYKNKWFSDGSLVSGNPAVASVLINEYGRGSDLREVDVWLDDNSHIIDELTSAIFSSEAPSYFDFFDADEFDIEAAKRGQIHFQAQCARCHGAYEKGWDTSETGPPREQMATTRVRYFANTPIHDVGTDPYRARAIDYLQELNRIALAEKHAVVLESQQGYVPPPLVGIWARWPYFHNMSAPTLCDVLTRGEDRPSFYVAGEPIDRERDFDSLCNGYPKLAPAHFDAPFDTRIPGLDNRGHDEGIFLRDGEELFSPAEKADLIRFLQTL